jgi:hypothetical protein
MSFDLVHVSKGQHAAKFSRKINVASDQKRRSGQLGIYISARPSPIETNRRSSIVYNNGKSSETRSDDLIRRDLSWIILPAPRPGASDQAFAFASWARHDAAADAIGAGVSSKSLAGAFAVGADDLLVAIAPWADYDRHA